MPARKIVPLGPLNQSAETAAERTCNGCAYYHTMVDLPPSTGFCLRYPPSIEYVEAKGRIATRFATTMAHWWCGEYKMGNAPFDLDQR